MGTHFRIELPTSAKGRKHTAATAKIYMIRDDEELELTKIMPITSWIVNWDIYEATGIEIRALGSVEVTYGERGSTP